MYIYIYIYTYVYIYIYIYIYIYKYTLILDSKFEQNLNDTSCNNERAITVKYASEGSITYPKVSLNSYAMHLDGRAYMKVSGV